MNLVKWNPWREVDVFNHRMNRFFNMSFLPATPMDEEAGLGNWRPVVDIYDQDDKLVIKAELPGVDKKDIELDFKDNVLTLRGERAFESEVNEESYYRKERSYGKFQRVFGLPADLDAEKIKADYKDGILRIEIPKPEEKKPRQISVH